jgi:hypothetical protein
MRYNINMALTPKGIVYPTSGDNIAPLETHFSALASSVDDAIIEVEDSVVLVQEDLDDFKIEVGVSPQSSVFTFTGPTSTTVPVDITVTLPGGYFSTAPAVVATVAGSPTASAYFPVLHSITASQFQARVWRTTGTAAESLTLQWIAK